MLEVRLLGRFEVRLDGKPVEIPSRPAQSLLAYLMLTAGTAHRREKLAGMFWPDAAETNARGYLRQALWRVRKAIEAEGSNYLAADELSLSFLPNSDYWLDAHTLERDFDLAGCVSVYHGDLLPGFYEDWVTLERERLRAIFERKMAVRLQQLSAAKQWHELLEEGQRWLALGGAPESAYRALMIAHAELDDPAGATAIYQRCVQTLSADLGVEPAAETRALYEKIRAGAEQPLVSLPIQPTLLVGREQELTGIAALLMDPACRLLTLIGQGGIGKTRLALAAAQAHIREFTHGVYFVSLAPLTSAQFLVPAIATGIGLTFFGSAEPKAQLFTYLRDREILIVLDSFEHLMSGAVILAEILASTTGIKLVVTSRERLRLQGEWLFEVPGLKYPEQIEPTSESERCSAVRLFLQTAQRMRPTFAPTEADSLAVNRICRLVAGLPLAIELAASWVRTFSCAEIAAELERGLGLLTAPLRDAPERHQSMQAVFDHSWRLLTADEQRTFRAQSVFRGGFAREAGQEVTAASPSVLSALADKSLLRRTTAGRFEIHELLRQYAYDQLRRSGEDEVIEIRHLSFFLSTAEQVERELRGPRQHEWLERLDADHDNLRAAMTWAFEHKQNESAARMCGALWRFWYMRGQLVEGRRWLSQALARERPLSDLVRAKALWGAANLAWLQGDYASARSLASESVALWRRLNDPRGLADALTILGLAQGYQGDQALAHSLLEESVAIFRKLGEDWGLALALFYYADPRAVGPRTVSLVRWVLDESLVLFQKTGNPWGMALPLHELGYWMYLQEEYGVARKQLEEALALRQGVGDNWLVAQTLGLLGDVARCQDDNERAGTLYAEGLKLYQAMGSEGRSAEVLHRLGCVALNGGDAGRAATCFTESLGLFHSLADRRGVAACIEGLAGVMEAQGDSQPAALLLGAATALRTANGILLPHVDRTEHERLIANLRAALSPDTYESAVAEGRTMPLEQVIGFALARAGSSARLLRRPA